MEVKNLHHRETFTETIARIHNLKPDSSAQWGKMNVAQMLRHCQLAFKVPLSDKPMKRMFLGRILGGLMKKYLYNEKPYGKGYPTSPHFLVKDEREFYKEKNELIEILNQFHSRGAGGSGKFPHPFFGSLSQEQWGLSMWKHLDHHLRQFGV